MQGARSIYQVHQGNYKVGREFQCPSQHWLHVISGMVRKLKKIHKTGDMILENIINEKKTKTDGDGSLLSYLLSLNDHGSSNPDGFHLTINNIKAVIQVKDIILGTQHDFFLSKAHINLLPKLIFTVK